jgi:hypothetical protein
LYADTLVGTWVAQPPPPPFTQEQLDSIYAAVLRRLIRMQVLLPERLESPPRIVLGRVHRTENGRAILLPSGDHLPYWPRGFDGGPKAAWSARCVADVPDQGSVVVDCFVHEPDGVLSYPAAPTAPRVEPPSLQWSDLDTMRVTVLVTTRGAYQIDTLRATVHPVPRLTLAAIGDADPPCGSWAAYSSEDSELYVLHGDPLVEGSLRITRVAQGRPPPSMQSAVPRCGPQEPRMAAFHAFLLGDVGDGGREPITLCYFSCTKSYVLDPARHTLVERGHLRFQRADLREETRSGADIMIRIRADRAPANLRPLVVYRAGGRWTLAWFARQVAPNTWDLGVSTNSPPDTQVHVYLIAR